MAGNPLDNNTIGGRGGNVSGRGRSRSANPLEAGRQPGTGRQGPAGTGSAPGRGGRTVITDPNRKKVFDMSLFFISLIFGALGGLAGLKVYELTVEKLNRPLVILLTVGVFYLIFALAVYIFQHLRGVYAKRKGLAVTLVPLLLFIICIPAFAGLFEFIYERGVDFRSSGASSYIFIIDDSSSMEGTDGSDPAFERYAAIRKILDKQPDDFPYAVYSFSSKTACTRPMAPKSEGVDVQKMIDSHVNMGMTNMLTALETVGADLDDMPGAGKSPKVLFLSDGYASDIDSPADMDTALSAFTKRGISISTVGLGDGADVELMQAMAEKTGGVYMSVSDVDGMANVMNEAIESYVERDLLSQRGAVSPDWLYMIERILFMALIGCAAGLSVLLTMGITSKGMTAIAAVIKGILAGLLLEVLINRLFMAESLADMLYFVLISVILSQTMMGSGRTGFGSNGGPEGGGQGEDPLSVREKTNNPLSDDPKTLY